MQESSPTTCATHPLRRSRSTRSGSNEGSVMRTRIVIACRLSAGAGTNLLANGPDASRRSDSALRCAEAHGEVVGELVDIAMRHAGGIEVALIWNRGEKSLVVFAYD